VKIDTPSGDLKIVAGHPILTCFVELKPKWRTAMVEALLDTLSSCTPRTFDFLQLLDIVCGRMDTLLYELPVVVKVEKQTQPFLPVTGETREIWYDDCIDGSLVDLLKKSSILGTILGEPRTSLSLVIDVDEFEALLGSVLLHVVCLALERFPVL
jgi:hypothetical protein